MMRCRKSPSGNVMTNQKVYAGAAHAGVRTCTYRKRSSLSCRRICPPSCASVAKSGRDSVTTRPSISPPWARLTVSASRRSALRFGLKLPTGDSDDFHGSGGTDISIGIAGDWKQLFDFDRLDAYYRAHISYIGEPDRLADRYEEFVGQLAFGAGCRLTPSMEMRLQASGRTANYESSIEVLGQESAWVTFGARFNVSSSWSLDLAVAEDIKVRSAPDVSFMFALHNRNDSD